MGTTNKAIPWPAKLGFTLWMLVWVPIVLLHHGPQNFFWLCNVAQFLVLYGLWTGNRLLLSSQAGVVLVVGLVWSLDFLIGLILGGSPSGATAYMFDPDQALIARASSLYHMALPPFLLWILFKTGYDVRGPWLQTVLGGVVVVVGWWLSEAERNINWVHEPFGMEQVWLPDPLWVLLLLLLYPLVLYFPGHWLLSRLLPVLHRR